LFSSRCRKELPQSSPAAALGKSQSYWHPIK